MGRQPAEPAHRQRETPIGNQRDGDDAVVVIARAFDERNGEQREQVERSQPGHRCLPVAELLDALVGNETDDRRLRAFGQRTEMLVHPPGVADATGKVADCEIRLGHCHHIIDRTDESFPRISRGGGGATIRAS
jgi:hypothetical protein